MADINGFDASTVEPSSDFAPIPKGDYPVCVVASEMKTSKAGDKYLALTAQVLRGEFQNRRIFVNLNLFSSNETAKQMSKALLSSLCRAVGIMTPSDSSELHDKPCIAALTVREGKGDYGPSNSVTAFKPLNAGPVAAATTTGVKTPW